MKSIPAASTQLKCAVLHCFSVLLFYSLLFILFFSPALFSGSLIGPVDGVFYHQPYFYAKKVLWDVLLSGGFPMMADPQVMTFYPPAFLFSLLPNGWNLFIISAYVLASCFTYGYVFALTESRLAALASGIIFGMSGFMVAQLDHAAIIHSAAWLPLIVWSLEMLRRKASPWWFGAGCFAVASSALAGHSQIFVYSLIVGTLYALALGWSARLGRTRFYFLSALMIALGVGLAAIQIIPTLELASQTLRASLSFEEFISYSLPVRQSLMLIFPALFGGVFSYNSFVYFGEWNLIEMTGYMGLSSLMLAAIGIVASRQKAHAIFWLSIAVFALLLTLGDATPLAALTYRVPVINLFRAPARHFLEMAFAASVLAGLGVRAVLEESARRALIMGTTALFLAIMAASLIALSSIHFDEYAAQQGVPRLSLMPWRNKAVGVPVVIFLISVCALLYWQRRGGSRSRAAWFLLVVTMELSSFGFFYARDYVAPKSILVAPPFVARYREALRVSNQRLLPVEGVLGPLDTLPPNISRLWDVPSASTHGPLILTRLVQMMGMTPAGNLTPAWQEARDRSLDLMAVRYVLLPRMVARSGRLTWLNEDLNLELGAGCQTSRPDSFKAEVAEPFSPTRLDIVSLLECSAELPDGAEVLRIEVEDTEGRIQTASLRAGLDTSEWAYDCADVHSEIKHQRAQIFQSFNVRRGDRMCRGHEYVARLALDGTGSVGSIRLKWMGAGALTIKKISLIDERTGLWLPIGAAYDRPTDSTRWRHLEDAGEASIYENLRAMPRAWLVPEVLTLKADEALAAIKSSRLPDGTVYDPSRTALIEEPLSLKAEGAGGRVEVSTLSSSLIELRTSNASPSFLVLSDIYYPGWTATVDAEAARLYRADFALRGLVVPAGSHIVRLEFEPRSFHYGLAASALSMLLVAIILLKMAHSRRDGSGSV